MNDLRWILLAAGVVLLICVYVWGVRSRRRSATPDFERARRVEPLPQAPVTAVSPAEPPQRREPRITLDDAPSPQAAAGESVPELDFDVGDALIDDASASPAPAQPVRVEAMRTEPTLSNTADIAAERESPAPRTGASEATRARHAQKIVSVRVTAPMPSRFPGAQLRDSIRSNGLQHGRFDIFHRLAPDGRPIISLASLIEPGTFDPSAMDGVSYPGVALFTVLPGPVSAIDALEDLLVTSRALAMQLKGTVLDDRGVPLSLQRIAHIRDEVLAFERGAHTSETAG